MPASSRQEIATRKRGSLASQVASSLEEMIHANEFKVGDKLPTENALGEMFDVSRTVIREAVSHLKSSGLVETRRGVGAFVLRRHADVASMIQGLSATTANEILDVLEFRMAIETEAAALAARRRTQADLDALAANLDGFADAIGGADFAKHADFEFHRLIGSATRNPVFVRFYDFFGLAMVPRSHIADLNERLEITRYLAQVLAEHREIYCAIVAGDPDRAEQTMRGHLSRSYTLYHTRAEDQRDADRRS